MDFFSWILVICLLLLVLGFIFNVIIPDGKSMNGSHSNSGSCEVFHYDFPVMPEGYYYHEMVGMYYRGITSKDFGVYDGYAIPEQNNKYDSYAVAIYRKSDNKHVGYVPAGNKELYQTLSYRGGKANAIFRIQGSSQHSYGTVYIEKNYKLFRVGNTKSPYLSRTTKSFDLDCCRDHKGKLRCWLTTKFSKNEYDYTVTAIDEHNVPIGTTDDNRMQLYDYVNERHDAVPACCNINADTEKGILFVPLNYTEKTTNKKIEEFMALG